MVVVVIAHDSGGQRVEVAFCGVFVVEELLPGLGVCVELSVRDHLFFAFWGVMLMRVGDGPAAEAAGSLRCLSEGR